MGNQRTYDMAMIVLDHVREENLQHIELADDVHVECPTIILQ
jgi:hypothetical protein